MVTVAKPSSRKFEFIAGNLALDFANTMHSVGADDPQDDLVTFSDLLVWVREAGLIKEQWRCSGTDFARFKDLRSAIYQMFAGTRDGRPKPEALAKFNAHLQEAMGRTQIERSAGAYRMVSVSSTPADRLRFEITRAAAEVLLSRRLDRVRQCAGDTCTWLFLDTSRNGTRRWCEMQSCGNRTKIRRFRKRLNS